MKTTIENSSSSVFNTISSPFAIALKNVNTVLFDWKFYTTFSILFGYGFGLILDSLEKKRLDSNAYLSGECSDFAALYETDL